MSKSELTSSGDDLLSEDNQELLKQLRQLIGETNASDHYLFKFLVARSKDPVKAANMFKATMEWRASYGADRLPHSSVTVTNSIRGFDFVADQDLDVTAPGVPAGWASFYHSLGPSCYHKTCKSGFPLYIDQMGRCKPSELATCDQESLLDFHICNLEFMTKRIMKELSTKHNRTISKHTIIFDLAGLGFQHANLKTINVLKALAQIDQAHYPELTHRLFIINAPFVFSSIFSMIKGWVDKGTLQKVHVLSSSYQKTLLEYIDADALPKMYGGTCECPHMPTGCIPSPRK